MTETAITAEILKDAARYRYLKPHLIAENYRDPDFEFGYINVEDGGVAVPYFEGELTPDEAIDLAVERIAYANNVVEEIGALTKTTSDHDRLIAIAEARRCLRIVTEIAVKTLLAGGQVQDVIVPIADRIILGADSPFNGAPVGREL